MAAEHTLAIKAPLTGVIVPLERVPDPVFSQKMVGDGVSIDPLSNELLAPCDGRIVQIHKAEHAVLLEDIRVVAPADKVLPDLKGKVGHNLGTPALFTSGN